MRLATKGWLPTTTKSPNNRLSIGRFFSLFRFGDCGRCRRGVEFGVDAVVDDGGRFKDGDRAVEVDWAGKNYAACSI
jgi:hypothetical protein